MRYSPAVSPDANQSSRHNQQIRSPIKPNKSKQGAELLTKSRGQRKVPTKSISPYKVKKSSQGQQILIEEVQQGPAVPTRSRNPYKVDESEQGKGRLS